MRSDQYRNKNSLSPADKPLSLIFDMDGTLIDTAKATIPACQKTARQMNIPVACADDIRQTIGWSESEFYQKLYPSLDKQLLIRYGSLVEACEARLIEDLGPDLVFPGIINLLEALTVNGHYLALASTGSQDHVHVAMKSTGLEKYFQMIRCGEPVKTDMVTQIMQKRSDDKWMMIGDKSKDATAAAENHIESIGVEFGYGTVEELRMFTYTATDTEAIRKLLSARIS